MRALTGRARSPFLAVVLAGLGLVALLAIAPAARGAVPHVFESVDEAFVEGDDSDKITVLAQSFVATANYKLIAVDLLVYDLSTTDLSTVQVVADAGGIPNGVVLGQGTADGSAGYDWLRFTLSPQPPLIAGGRYWIELLSGENPPDGYRWAKSLSNSYTAGTAAYYRGSSWNPEPGVDYLFRTWGVSGPSIAVGISVDSGSAGPGDPLRYTVAFDNVGTAPATRVWVNWTPSPDVTYVSDDAALIGGVPSTRGWVFDGVAVGPHSFHVDVVTAPDVFDGLPLTTAVDVVYAEGSVIQERSNASVTTIARVPSLIVSSAATPAFVGPGDNLTFRVSISNVGSRPAGRVWLNDTLPGNVTYVSNTASSLQNYTGEWMSGRVLRVNLTNLIAGVYSFDINVTVDAGVGNGTWLVNWVSLNYTDSQGRLRDPTSASAVARVHGASIHVFQSTLATSVQPRETVRFTVRLDNQGNAASRDVWVNDTLPTGLLYVSDTAGMDPAFVDGTCGGSSCSWHFSDVPPGPHSILLTTTVDMGLPDGAVLVNSVRLEYTNSDGLPLEPSTSVSAVAVSRPVLGVAVSANGFANPGDRLGYYATLDNSGSGVAALAWLNVTPPSGAVYESDNMSTLGASRTGPWSWLLRNVSAGVHPGWISVRIPAGIADGSPLTATFRVEYTDEEDNLGAPVSVSVPTVITAPDLRFTLTANRGSAAPGDLVTYSIVAENFGSGIAADVWINNTIPSGTTFVRSSLQYTTTSGSAYTWHLQNVGPGTLTLEITVRLDADAPTDAYLVNSARAEYTDANGNRVASWTADEDVLVQPVLFTPGATLPIAVLVLIGVTTALVGYLLWKVHGVGSRDKARIDELFLLHRSGELIRHLTRSLRTDIDSDVLSGMLIAVQNFVKESFQFVQGGLEELKFGSHRIMLAHGKELILAAVVAGRLTDRLAPVLFRALEEIEADHADVLANWSGMPSAFTEVDRHLEGILSGKGTNGHARVELWSASERGK